MGSVIFHIDYDSFFASVEQQYHKKLRGKPIGVTGSSLSRGVICAASREAKKFGVKTAMPVFEAKKLCPHIITVKGDFDKYQYIHKKTLEICNKYSDLIEELNLLTKDSGCFQAFSYDQAIFYLLNKKSCSKFYNIWVIGSKKNQKIYIDELKFNNPKYILTEGPFKFYSPYKRYPHIKKFLDKEYSLYKSIHSWKILKKNS